jgi:hypothetical protein
MQEEDVDGLYNCFAPQDKGMSPANGLMLLRSGTLHRVRFDSYYGAYDPRFLCHYSIRKPSRHEPRDNVDSPHSYTCSVVQQVFPSSAGNHLSIPGNHGDLFRLMPLREIGKLLRVYRNVKQGANESELRTLMHSYFNPPQQQKRVAVQVAGWTLNRSHRKEMQKIWTDEYETLPDRYADMFIGAAREADEYPADLVEGTLQALAWTKAENVSEFSPLLNEIGYPNAGVKGPSRFNKAFYESWVTRIKASHSEFSELAKDSEALIYVTLAEDIFASPYPRSLGAGTAIHTYADEKGIIRQIQFSDCGEAFFRSLFGQATEDPVTRTFNTTFLEQRYPNLYRPFIYFFNGNPDMPHAFCQHRFEDINDSVVGRSAFANVVSSRNEENDPNPIAYRNKGRCNIKGTGFDNALAVCEKIFQTTFVEPGLVFANKRARRAYRVTKMFEGLSHAGHVMTWYLPGPGDTQITDQLGIFGKINVQVNGVQRFICHVGHHHYYLQVSKQNESDWRQTYVHNGVAGTLLSNFANPADPFVCARLMPMYRYGFHSDMDGLTDGGNQPMSWNKLPAAETLFGFDLNGGEEKIEAIESMLQRFPKAAVNIVPYWLRDIVLTDNVMGGHVFTLLYKYKDLLIGSVITEDKFPRLYNFFYERLSFFQRNGLCKELYYVADLSRGAHFMLDFLQDKQGKDIGTFLISQDELSEDESDSSSDAGSDVEENSEVQVVPEADMVDQDNTEPKVFNLLSMAVSTCMDEAGVKLVQVLMDKAGPEFFGPQLPDELKCLNRYIIATRLPDEAVMFLLSESQAQSVFFPEGDDDSQRLRSIKVLTDQPSRLITATLIPALRPILLKPEIYNPSTIEEVRKYRDLRRYRYAPIVTDEDIETQLTQKAHSPVTQLTKNNHNALDAKLACEVIDKVQADDELLGLLVAPLSDRIWFEYIHLNRPFFMQLLRGEIGIYGRSSRWRSSAEENDLIAGLSQEDRALLFAKLGNVGLAHKWSPECFITVLQKCLQCWGFTPECQQMLDRLIDLRCAEKANPSMYGELISTLRYAPFLIEFYKNTGSTLDDFHPTNSWSNCIDLTVKSLPAGLSQEHIDKAHRSAVRIFRQSKFTYRAQAETLLTLYNRPLARMENDVEALLYLNSGLNLGDHFLSETLKEFGNYDETTVNRVVMIERDLIHDLSLKKEMNRIAASTFFKFAAGFDPQQKPVVSEVVSRVRARAGYYSNQLTPMFESLCHLTPEHQAPHVALILDTLEKQPAEKSVGLIGDFLQVPPANIECVCNNVLRFSEAPVFERNNLGFSSTRDYESWGSTSALIQNLGILSQANMAAATRLFMSLGADFPDFNMMHVCDALNRLALLPDVEAEHVFQTVSGWHQARAVQVEGIVPKSVPGFDSVVCNDLVSHALAVRLHDRLKHLSTDSVWQDMNVWLMLSTCSPLSSLQIEFMEQLFQTCGGKFDDSLSMSVYDRWEKPTKHLLTILKEHNDQLASMKQILSHPVFRRIESANVEDLCICLELHLLSDLKKRNVVLDETMTTHVFAVLDTLEPISRRVEISGVIILTLVKNAAVAIQKVGEAKVLEKAREISQTLQQKTHISNWDIDCVYQQEFDKLGE